MKGGLGKLKGFLMGLGAGAVFWGPSRVGAAIVLSSYICDLFARRLRLGNWRCTFGSHRYGAWVWDGPVETGKLHLPLQRRRCEECSKEQGPIASSEERHYFEGWRDR